MSLVLLGAPAGESDTSTDILCRRIAGLSKSLVRFAIAVDPTLAVDAPVNVDGWAAQVHRLTDHVRVVTALVPGDLPSWPRQPNVMRVALGEGVTPAEDGVYPTLDLSGMEIRLTINGTVFIGALDEAIHTNKIAPIGPGLRGQTGPDLLRRTHYLVRFKRSGVVGDGTETTDYVALADVHVTTRVDMDYALIEIHVMNGAWKSTNNAFVENPSCSGPLHFDSIHVARTTLPTGYSAELFAAHPYSSVTVSNVWVTSAMVGANDIHFMPSGSQHVCRFAVWNPATVTATQGREALRGYDRGRTVSGPLSYHHRHAYGTRRDLVLDIQAFRRDTEGNEVQWREPGQGNTDTWLRQDALASGAAAQLRSAWGIGAANSNYNIFTTRRGWHYPFGSEANAGPGGDGIYGHSVGHQARAAFETNTMHLDALTTRLGHAQIDLVDGMSLNGDKMVANNSAAWEDLLGNNPGQVGRLPYWSNNSDRKIAWLHPHLTPSNTLANDWGSQNPNQFRLAPTSRPWNAPYASKTCPYRAAIDWHAVSGENGWSPFDMAHSSRAIMPIEQGIWLWDDPIAHRLLEQIACSRAMLGMTQYSLSGHMHASFQSWIAPLEEIVAANVAPPNAGYYQMAPGQGKLGANFRSQAWMLTLATMWWEVAPAAERARISPAPGVGNSWFRAVNRYCSEIFLLNGYGIRTDGDNTYYSPDPYNAAQYGPTDIPNRRGAFPRTGGFHWTTTVDFHGAFMTAALFGLKHGPLAGQPLADANDPTIRVALNWARMARANFPTEARKTPTKYSVMSTGPSGLLDPPATPAQMDAGLMRWALFQQWLPGAPVHRVEAFQGWVSTYGYRDSGDPAMFDATAYDHSAPAGNEVAAFNALEASYAQAWTSPNYQALPFSDANWWTPVLAELIHRREQRTT